MFRRGYGGVRRSCLGVVGHVTRDLFWLAGATSRGSGDELFTGQSCAQHGTMELDGRVLVEEAIHHIAEQEIEQIADVVCAEMEEARTGDGLGEDGDGGTTRQLSYMAEVGNLSPWGTVLKESLSEGETGPLFEKHHQGLDDAFRMVTGKSKGVRARLPYDRELRFTVRASQNSFHPLPYD